MRKHLQSLILISVLVLCGSCYSKYIHPFPYTELVVQPGSGTEYRVGEEFSFFARARFPDSAYIPSMCQFLVLGESPQIDDFSVDLIRGKTIEGFPPNYRIYGFVQDGDDCIIELRIIPLTIGTQNIRFSLTAIEEPPSFWSYQALWDADYSIEVGP